MNCEMKCGVTENLEGSFKPMLKVFPTRKATTFFGNLTTMQRAHGKWRFSTTRENGSLSKWIWGAPNTERRLRKEKYRSVLKCFDESTTGSTREDFHEDINFLDRRPLARQDGHHAAPAG